MRALVRLFVITVASTLGISTAAHAYAQGSFFTSLSGTVVDTSGGVIPGANVKIKNNGTGAEFNTTSASDGGFTVPSLPGGNYSVTVSLMGFKTAVLNNVTLNAAIPANVKVTLAVGTLEENVTVTGDSALVVQTQTPSIATNLTGTQIASLPLSSRNALDALTSLAGFNTSGTARNSTVNGLPKSAINITLDGMNIQDNFAKTSDGYYARVTPTLDSVEEVTVTAAGNTADATGQGGVQITFVTKSGSNRWIGTAYEYLRHDALNANTWFNNRDLPPDPATGKAPKTQLRDYQQGLAQGGPIVKNKAFFFFNYEEERSPSTSTLQRVVLTQDAANGIFSYNTAAGVRQVNLPQLARDNGQLATFDPTIARVLRDIRSTTATSGSVSALSNPLVQQYTFQTPTNTFNPSPSARVDVNLSQNHRLTGSMNYRHVNLTPDTVNNAQVPFPGFPQTGSQQATRWTTSESLRSTVGSNLVNEARFGGTGGAVFFSPELSPSLWQGTGLGRTNGYRLDLFNACCGVGFRLTNPNTANGPNSGGAANGASREASTWVVEDSGTWIRGKHSVTVGGSMTQADVWEKNQTLIPTATFNVLATESAASMFTAANFPGASATDLSTAQSLYAMLTGRITSLTGNARINPAGDAFVPLGESTAQGRMREFDFYAADQWRMSANLTVSAGLRYVLSLPFYPTNNSYTTVTDASLYGISGVGNLFQPGTLTGTRPNYIQYPAGTYAYNVDKSNFGPSLGLAWQLRAMNGGIGRAIFGSQEGDSVIRGGFALAYQRPGMSDFTGVFGANQGIQVTLQRDNTNTALPILLRDSPTLPNAPAVVYPITPTITNSVNRFDSNLQIPYTQSYTVGWQRKLGRDTAVEIRYVGSRHRRDWETIDLNEANIVTNGFVNEFRRAQANLQANIAAGRGATFAYTGAPGTTPLPIFLAYLNGQPSGRAGDPIQYSGANWTNANFLGYLAAQNPNPLGFMCNNATGCSMATLTNGFLGNTTFRNNAAGAGLPANFFVANPDVLGGVLLTTNVGGTRYNSMQVELRKRLSNGFQVNTSYAWGQAYITQRYGLQKPTAEILQTGQVGGVQRAFKANWIYDLPFGREQRWGGNAGSAMDALIGGWSIDGVARIQTGEMLDFGNVRLVGMTEKEFRDAVDLRVGANGQLFILPDDIIQNTVRAFQVSATSSTGYGALGAPTGRYLAPANNPDCIETSPAYGDCGVRSLVVNGPPLVRFDIGASKRVKVHGPITLEFRAEMLNAFNKPYFNPVLGLTTTYFPILNQSQTLGNSQGPVANNGTPISNAIAGTSADSFRLTRLLGDNTARIMQLVWRVRW